LPKFQALLSKVTPEQGDILKAKYNGINFGSMGSTELTTASAALLAGIKIITGWTIPTGQGLELLKAYLAAELKKEYTTLTVKEVELAFKLHAAKVIEYGKDLSIALFNKVMDFYFVDRNEACTIESTEMLRIEESKKLTEEQIANIGRSNVEESYQDYLQGKFDPLQSLSSASMYDRIISDGMGDPSLHMEYLSGGFEMYKSSLLAEKEKLKQMDANKSSSRRDEISYKLRIGEIDQELFVIESVYKNAKKYALKYCYDWMKGNGIGFYKRENQQQ
jgi:hypothetical protein